MQIRESKKEPQPRFFLYPNGRVVESVSSARDVGSWFVRRHMLARSVRAGLCFCEGRYQTRMAGWGACQFRMRRWQPASQKAHARTGSANRTHRLRAPCEAPLAEGGARMTGWWNLLFLHAPLAISLSVSKCWHSLCRHAQIFFPHKPIIINPWGMGACPHD